MLGALIGIKRLPNSMVMNLLRVDDDYDDARQDFLSVRKNALKNIDLLIESMPKSQLIIVEQSKDNTDRLTL